MDNEAQLRGYRLFQAALNLSVPEYEEFLAAHEAADPEAVQYAREALKLHAQTTGLPGGPVIEADPRRSDRTGSSVAGWNLEKLLGAGGFGRVYLASKTSPAGREDAAIKFLDIAPGQVPRFLRERQLLADLNHPGLPRFLDAGTSEGVPYLVMEYVSGQPITRYCQARKLTVSSRLDLFMELCRIMEYAHERVLHRDLKPENILVMAGGQVRVLDLGLARDAAEPGDALTQPGAPLFTKAYASPEQVKQQPLSWATDVYALGVILYELVTGRLPFTTFVLEGPDWREIICEREPLRPSDAVHVGQAEPGGLPRAAPPETASPGGARPSKLRRLLAGDLDAIILKALAKDPRQRYRRVQDLRAELERFQNGLPVGARRSPLYSRLWRWSVKNPRTAALLAASSLWLIGAAHIGALRYIEYNARAADELNAVRRVDFLLRSGVSEIERSIPKDAATLPARVAAARIHSRLLERTPTLPDTALQRLDRSLMESALDCGAVWIDLGDPASGLIATAPATARARIRHESDPNEPLWRRLYGSLLRQRINMYVMLDQGHDAESEARRLAELERKGP